MSGAPGVGQEAAPAWRGTRGLAWRASGCRQGPVSTPRGPARSGSLVLLLRGTVTSLESGALRWREVWQSVAEAGRGIQTESAGVRRVAFHVCDRERSWYQLALPPPGVPQLASDPFVPF